MNQRLETVKQLLRHLQDARSGESEDLMKEVWENCSREDFEYVNEELDHWIRLLGTRALELSAL